jgi:hypothetical protein
MLTGCSKQEIKKPDKEKKSNPFHRNMPYRLYRTAPAAVLEAKYLLKPPSFFFLNQH